MTDLGPIQSGGLAAFLMALGYVLKQGVDYLRERRRVPHDAASASISDQAAANATLVRTLDSLQKENTRMAARIAHLEDEAETKDAKITDLEHRLNGIAAELAALKARH